TLNQFRVRPRLALRLRSKLRSPFVSAGGFTRSGEDAASEKLDLDDFARGQRALRGGDRRRFLVLQEVRVSQRGKFCGGLVGVLGRQVVGCALLQKAAGIRETA